MSGGVDSAVSAHLLIKKGEKYAEEVIEECAAFPHGANDDYVDSTTQAVLRYRQGNFIEMVNDYEEELYKVPKEYKYYG